MTPYQIAALAVTVCLASFLWTGTLIWWLGKADTRLSVLESRTLVMVEFIKDIPPRVAALEACQ